MAATVNGRRVALEAATACQLKCPSCPTASGKTARTLGRGTLALDNFVRFLDANPQVVQIELSNWGEILLNKDLPRILEQAHRRNVALFAANGVNLNHASPEALEAIVRYRLREMTCSIDGASQDTYVRYRVGGNFDRVIENVETINRLKREHRTRFPALNWQFVIFGHNEHEIERARERAAELGMCFLPKLAWGDLFDQPGFPVRDRERVRRLTGLEAADRDEFRERHGQEYNSGACHGMWNEPHVNFDGRVVGCAVNYWGDYGNAFYAGLDAVINGERMRYARAMLTGRKPARDDIPCATCKVFASMRRHRTWIREEQVAALTARRRRWQVRIENNRFGETLAHRSAGIVRTMRRGLRRLRKSGAGR